MSVIPSKTVVNSDAGTVDKVGGNDWDGLIAYLQGSLELKAVAEPTTPPSGSLRYWLDSTTGKFSVKHSDGRVVILE